MALTCLRASRDAKKKDLWGFADFIIHGDDHNCGLFIYLLSYLLCWSCWKIKIHSYFNSHCTPVYFKDSLPCLFFVVSVYKNKMVGNKQVILCARDYFWPFWSSQSWQEQCSDNLMGVAAEKEIGRISVPGTNVVNCAGKLLRGCEDWQKKVQRWNTGEGRIPWIRTRSLCACIWKGSNCQQLEVNYS